MATLFGIVAAIFCLGVLLQFFSDEKTKLFRRIWSTERAGGSQSYMREKQQEAFTTLCGRYELRQGDNPDNLRKSSAALLADAMTFDMKNPNNMGVTVTPVLVREIKVRFPQIAD